MSISRTSKIFLCAVLALSFSFGATPVLSQGAIINLMGRMVEEGIRAEEARRHRDFQRQQDYQRAQESSRRDRARRSEIREREIALVRRAQAALQSLGFYTSGIDGDRGPGTRGAEAAYRAAFRLGDFDITEADVSRLEARAAVGFRSAAEHERAARGGFVSRADLVAAEAGGFTQAPEFEEARRLGFRTAATYDRFRRSGHRTPQDFAAAESGGFSDASEFAEAREKGFAQKAEYRAFLRSGLPDKDAYLEHKDELAARDTARSGCLDAAGSDDLAAGVDACLAAVSLGADDEETQASFARLGARLKDALDRLEETSGATEAGTVEMASAGNQEQAVAAGPDTATQSDAGGYLAERARLTAALRAHDCGAAHLEKSWGLAETACAPETDSEVLAALREVAAEQAEAERAQAAAEAERRRQEAEAERKRIALAAARTAAQDLLDEVGEYSAGQGALDNPLGVAKALVAVRTGIEGEDPRALEQALAHGRALLERESGFQGFLADKARAEQVADVNARTTALAEVARIEAFIERHVARNILDPEVGDLLALQGRLAEARASGRDEAILNGQRDARLALEKLGLSEALAGFVVETDAAEAPEVETAANGIAVTDLNRALLTGDGNDVLVLGNFRPTAPHLVVNLLGETAFDGHRADYCWSSALPEAATSAKLALKAVADTGGTTQRDRGRCAPGALEKIDVVLLHRGSFLSGDVLKARRLIEAFETQDLRLIATVDWATVGARAEREQKEAEAIALEVAAGAREGYGLTAFDNGADRVCLAIPGSDDAAHRLVLDRSAETLRLFVGDDAEMAVMPLERAFIDAQRRNCSAIYAAAGDMGNLLTASDRAGLDHAVLPLWFGTDALEQARADLAAVADGQERQLAATRQQLEGRRALAAEQAAEAEVVRRRREAELRARYSQEATAVYDELVGSGEAFLRGQSREAGSFGELFGAVRHWKSRRDADGWETAEIDSRMLDYGTAAWRGRRAEVVFAEMRVRSKNRVLGEYADDCFVVGYLVDDEFQLLRDPFEAMCQGSEALIADWKTGRDFESRWVAELASSD